MTENQKNYMAYRKRCLAEFITPMPYVKWLEGALV
jgi:hypothetical protein